MRAPKQNAWERVLSRWFSAIGIPLRWDGHAKRFLGMSGHSFMRINPFAEEKFWERAPERFHQYEKERAHGKRLIMIVASKRYGDNVEDALVLTNIGTFAPMLKAFIDADKERWIDDATP